MRETAEARRAAAEPPERIRRARASPCDGRGLDRLRRGGWGGRGNARAHAALELRSLLRRRQAARARARLLRQGGARPRRPSSAARRNSTSRRSGTSRGPSSTASTAAAHPYPTTGLAAGETFLDLGSGAGIDVFIAAKKVGAGREGHRRRHDRRDALGREREPADRRRKPRVSTSSSSARASSRRFPRTIAASTS